MRSSAAARWIISRAGTPRRAIECERVIAFGSTSVEVKHDSADARRTRRRAAPARGEEARVRDRAAHAAQRDRAAADAGLRRRPRSHADPDRAAGAALGRFLLPRDASGLRQPVHVDDLADCRVRRVDAPPRMATPTRCPVARRCRIARWSRACWPRCSRRRADRGAVAVVQLALSARAAIGRARVSAMRRWRGCAATWCSMLRRHGAISVMRRGGSGRRRGCSIRATTERAGLTRR